MWVYIKCEDSIYSPESVESLLPSVTMSSQSPMSKLIDIAKRYYYQECIPENYLEPQFGTMSQSLTHESCQKSTSLQRASHAKIFLVQDLEKAWKESEADYFLRSCAWPKKSSPSSYFLKTCPQSHHEADFESLEKLPRWGMIVDGVLYPLKALEHYTVERDGSCWPTPQARAQTDTLAERKRHTPCLHSAVLMATPTASQASKPIRAASPTRQNGAHGEDLQESIGRLHPSSIGKKLCVRWTSVLMGYLTTHTDLEPLGILWFQSRQGKHLNY